MHRDMFKIQDGVAIVEKLNSILLVNEPRHFHLIFQSLFYLRGALLFLDHKVNENNLCK